ncbi:hypothetical protein BCR39DRAFT_596451 [Naematelia encephala]|uniref:Uncharacterized protein n=1 Tax=Naematelia encephala TaxID=71784 RepID=A0A1Y2BMN4_9TREE|nr:hypothetical protein BCR39DRAFT_596451 [Naematelia encephala]
MSLEHRPTSLTFPTPSNGPQLSDTSSRSPRLPSSPVLLHPLPPSQALQRESLAQSELELDRQTRQRQRERELAEALQEQQWEIQRATARDEIGTSTIRRTADKDKDKGKGKDVNKESRGFTRPPQAYELYQAIDKHDIDFIMRVRDHAFGLLLAKNAGEFPIVYAARIGESHRDIVILLVGALSRYVNHLEDEDFEKKETRNILKALRSNLKLAIDNALLPSHSTHLLSSYLQVLIMSEGDAWLHKATYDVSLLVRAPDEKPVASAEEMVRRFCTKELRGAGGVEEYITNAALDLVIMAVWSVAAQQMGADPLPTHTFARDTRTYSMLKEAMEENKGKLVKVSPRIRRFLDVLLERAGDTKKSIPGRLRDVQEVLDGE